MKQSTQRIQPSTLERAARVPTIGAATVTRLRAESSINDATQVDRSAPRYDAWPRDRCAIAESPVVESEASALDSPVGPLSYELYQEARRRRSAFLADLMARAIRGIAAAVLRAWTRYRQSRHARATYEALHELDDRSLHDLGFARDEIRSVAAEMAGQAQHSRRLLRSTLHGPHSFPDTMFRD